MAFLPTGFLLLSCLHMDYSTCRREGGAVGIPLMSVRVVWVCAQGRREVLYMTRRFHGNVVRRSKGAYLMELQGVA